MTSWFSSWLPAFPSFDFSYALPSAIQRRFISFVLKRSLGHFVRPGQFDIDQVDSQIGSGYVQVKDLRLDENAINALIDGLPVRLRDGSVSSVVARIPWPNPLTSTIGLSIQSLHLVFDIMPGVSMKKQSAANLAESVASVAESFIHEELTSREETVLRHSLHPDMGGLSQSVVFERENVPGGFDFDIDPFHSPDAEAHEGTEKQFDPEGVGIFATLIEGLLARFKFDVNDVRITIVDPNNASFTLAIPEIQYGTEPSDSTARSRVPEPDKAPGEGATRTLTISGVTLSSRCLRPVQIDSSEMPSYAPSTTSTLSPVSPVQASTVSSSPSPPAAPARSDTPEHHPVLSASYAYAQPLDSASPSDTRTPSPTPSYTSDSSSMDEETQMMMSQSLVSLPPRPPIHHRDLPQENPGQETRMSVSTPVNSTVASPPLSRQLFDLDEEEDDQREIDTPVSQSFPRYTLPQDDLDGEYGISISPPLNAAAISSPVSRQFPDLGEEVTQGDIDTPVSRSLASLTFQPASPVSPTGSIASTHYRSISSGSSSESIYHRPSSPASPIATTTYRLSGSPSYPTTSIQHAHSSPANSVASSLYQSAISSTGVHIPGAMYDSAVHYIGDDDGREEAQLLFGHDEPSLEGTDVSPPRSPVPEPSKLDISQSEDYSESSPVNEANTRGQSSADPGVDSEASQPTQVDDENEVLLSFGPEPIVIRLSTPSVQTSSPNESPSPSQLRSQSSGLKARPADTTKQNLGDVDKSKISISIGVLACALRARHVQSISRLLSHLPSSSNTRELPIQSPSTRIFEQVAVEVTIRGVVLIIITSLPLLPPNHGLNEFFSHPLFPPRHLGEYLRLHLDGISFRLSSLPTAMTAANSKKAVHTKSKSASSNISAIFSLYEISAFAFVTDGTASDLELFALPILIPDHHLASQYSPLHTPPTFASPSEPNADVPALPTFDVSDWTDVKYRTISSKISTWRTRIPQQRQHGRAPSQGLRSSPGRPSVSTNASSPRSGKSLGLTNPDPQRSPAIVMTAKIYADAFDVRVKLIPLHVFVDLGLVSARGEMGGSGSLLSFLAEVLDADDSRSPEHADDPASDIGSEYDDEDEDGATPPATPRRASFMREEERERERRRLERLVLQDLDLSFDYREEGPKMSNFGAEAIRGRAEKPKKRTRRQVNVNKQNPSRLSFSLDLPMLRIQVRCPSPPSGSPPRSGAMVLDLHNMKVFFGSAPSPSDPFMRARFTEPDGASGPPRHSEIQKAHELVRAEWGRIVVAYAGVGERKANAIASLGPLSVHPDAGDTPSGINSPFSSSTALPALLPRICLTRPDLSSRQSQSPGSTTLVLAVDFPSAHVAISKLLWDGVQLWADDVAQLVERSFDVWDSYMEKASSRNTSLIGSRYFVRQGSSSASSRTDGQAEGSKRTLSQGGKSEMIMKMNISEVLVRVVLPREAEGSSSERPFDVSASEVDILIETKPEGKDQTVITLGVTDISIHDMNKTKRTPPMLSLTKPRSMAAASRSMFKLRFTSLTVSDTSVKQSRVKLTLSGFTYNILPDFEWANDLARFAKAPPGVFESVVPSESTHISIKIHDGSLRSLAPTHPGALALYLGEAEFVTDVIGDSLEMAFNLVIPSLSIFLIDDIACVTESPIISRGGHSYWKETGYALITEIHNLHLGLKNSKSKDPPNTEILVDGLDLRVHLCGDTISALIAFAGDLSSVFKGPTEDKFSPKTKKRPVDVSEQPQHGLSFSVDEQAFKRLPEVGAAPDMISDDLPSNADYLDASYGAAAGFRELTDDDLDEFDEEDIPTETTPASVTGIISNVGGETIRILDPEGVNIVENYFESITPESSDGSPEVDGTTFHARVRNGNVSLFLYEGYDWLRTRKTIEEEMKAMKRRLAKIRQLLASGQTYDPGVEETSALLFNSVYIGLDQDIDELEPGALIAVIDEELKDDLETATQSSWQSLRPQVAGKQIAKSTRVRGQRLTRSKGPSMEIRLMGLHATVEQYELDRPLASRIFVTVKDLEILDHIKTSTWRKFLSELMSDSRGNMRETDSNMVRIELCSIRPVSGHTSEEARLRIKILPLRLHVDQDALDFLKKFFSFQDPQMTTANPGPPADEIYFQQAEIFPVDIKMDYKPRRVDYRALREGKTIELMNFFHFDGAEMTLRHLTLYGITGWPRLFDMLNDLWTPDVKATQMVDIISGVSPIRSVVNVGSGVADLVLLPIAQYKKDGRVIRGMQKGSTAFVKSTAMEAIRLGARLATGTQVILEQAENVLGGQLRESLNAEAMQSPGGDDFGEQRLEVMDEDEETRDLISRYAEQPSDVKEGMQFAYQSLRRNFNSAAQTILAVPMEVYERTGNEGPVRAVIRAVPIAILKPMIGASEAVSKTLLGLQNQLDPNVRQETEAKYKQR